ncbi:MAG: McrC family protein, partial [Saprospiraceae bacterium]
MHRGVRFSHYVGVLQVNDLTIEILPKADRALQPNRAVWHSVLLDMLRYCRLINIEALNAAPLRLRKHSILELYYEIFLTEVEALLKNGLLRTYRREQGQSPVLKGKLLISEHLRRNVLHRERFYINYQTYDYQHPLNQMLYAALLSLDQLLQKSDLRARLQRILQYFPNQKVRRYTADDFLKIRYDRQTLRYKNAIEIARLLLLNYSPDIRGGQQHLLAILFDMNLLYEEYVYQQLKRLNIPELVVRRQQTTPFWNRRTLRPDIILEHQEKRYVLDTKWKILKRVHPNLEDVKQMYIYNQFFAAEHGVLLYPQVNDLPQLPPIPYQTENLSPTYC